MTPSELRAQFPIQNRITWLNAAASSPTPLSVYAATDAFLREMVDFGDSRYPTWARLKEEVRARLARFIGADPQELAFTPSTSFGFHVIGQMLKARGIGEVLTLEAEFPSTTLPLLYDGLTLRGVRARADGSWRVADLEAALTPRTGAIAVSAVQYASGFRIDLEAVSALCRSRGLTLVVNAAQGLGLVPLDVRRLGIHFLAATSHKWFMAGHGMGMLYIEKAWAEQVRLPFGGWLSVAPEELFQPWVHADRVDDATGFTAKGTRFRHEASALEAGGGAWVGLHAVNAALDIHEALGPPAVLAHDIGLQLRLREQLRRAGFSPNTPDDPDTLSGICVIPVAGPPLEVVRALLHDAHIATTARGGGLRISTHAYNDESDLERLMHAFERLGVKPG